MKNIILVALIMLISIVQVQASWDVFYNGSNLPEDSTPSWSSLVPWYSWDGSVSTDGTALNILDNSISTYAYYQRDSLTISAGTPVTMEAQVKILMATSAYSAIMSFQTLGATAIINLYTDHVVAYYSGVDVKRYDVDMTRYRTLRLAVDTSNNVSLWIDGRPALSWQDTSPGGQNGVRFGSCSISGRSNSYWKYVAYSNDFLPVPEPSSILALLTGMVGVGGIAWRRR